MTERKKHMHLKGYSHQMDERIKYPLRDKMVTLVGVAIVPLFFITVYLIFALMNYSSTYDEIVSNMTIANN